MCDQFLFLVRKKVCGGRQMFSLFSESYIGIFIWMLPFGIKSIYLVSEIRHVWSGDSQWVAGEEEDRAGPPAGQPPGPWNQIKERFKGKWKQEWRRRWWVERGVKAQCFYCFKKCISIRWKCQAVEIGWSLCQRRQMLSLTFLQLLNFSLTFQFFFFPSWSSLKFLF